jgi:hypothetical protein
MTFVSHLSSKGKALEMRDDCETSWSFEKHLDLQLYSHVSFTCFQLLLLPLIQQTTNMASSDRFVAVGEEEILYIISNIFAMPQVLYYLVLQRV